MQYHLNKSCMIWIENMLANCYTRVQLHSCIQGMTSWMQQDLLSTIIHTLNTSSQFYSYLLLQGCAVGLRLQWLCKRITVCSIKYLLSSTCSEKAMGNEKMEKKNNQNNKTKTKPQ